jgi:predicted transcriptional regulator YdeE
LIIPAGKYQKFTTKPGKMPEVVIQAWQKIWSMDNNQLGGIRNYQADFEIYHQVLRNVEQVIVDIYIGVK